MRTLLHFLSKDNTMVNYFLLSVILSEVTVIIVTALTVSYMLCFFCLVNLLSCSMLVKLKELDVIVQLEISKCTALLNQVAVEDFSQILTRIVWVACS